MVAATMSAPPSIANASTALAVNARGGAHAPTTYRILTSRPARCSSAPLTNNSKRRQGHADHGRRCRSRAAHSRRTSTPQLAQLLLLRASVASHRDHPRSQAPCSTCAESPDRQQGPPTSRNHDRLSWTGQSVDAHHAEHLPLGKRREQIPRPADLVDAFDSLSPEG